MLLIAFLLFIGAGAAYLIAKKEYEKDPASSIVVCCFGLVFIISSLIIFLEVVHA